MGNDGGKSFWDKVAQKIQVGDVSDEVPQQANGDGCEETDKVVLSFEEAQRVIDKQFEAHYSNQDSIFRLFRSIVAVTAVTVTVLSVVISQNVPSTVQVPSFSQNFDNAVESISTSVTIWGQVGFSLPQGSPLLIVVLSEILFILLAYVISILGIIALVGVIITTLLSLSPPVLRPIHGKSSVVEISDHDDVNDDLKETYKGWIESNQKPLRISNQRLSKIYKQMLSASIFLGLAIIYSVLFYFAAIGPGILITLILGLLVLLYEFLSPATEEYEDFAIMLRSEKIVQLDTKQKQVLTAYVIVSTLITGFLLILI